MKRDMELVRKLLLYIEENCMHDALHSSQISVDGYSSDEIAYNIHVMVGGGLLDVVDASAMGDRFGYYLIKGISWYGHEFLDSVRNEGVWSHTKEALRPVGSASLGVIMSIATSVLNKQLGL